MKKVCKKCQDKVDVWNKKCGGCGFTLVLQPNEKIKARYLRTPSLGALLFTQGWTLGSRLYVWFLLSLVPVVGIVALFACMFFGRRWSYKQGGWASWEEFTDRMKLMDRIGMAWVAILLISYFFAR
jgi:hypothetical protein